MSLFAELSRRNIYRVALAYVVLGWLLLEGCAMLVDYAGIPAWIYRFAFALMVIGFPLALVLSWIFELTPEGLRREFEVERNRSITRQTGDRLLRLTLLAALLLVLLNLLRFVLD